MILNLNHTATPLLLAGLFILSVFVCLPASAQAEADIQVNSLHIDGRIINGYAVTEVTQNFTNSGTSSGEVEFRFGIPERAFLSNLTVTVNGKTFYGQSMRKAAAQETYDSAVSSGKTAGMVSNSPSSNVFATSLNVAGGQTAEVSLRYEEFIPRTRGEYIYSIPTSASSYPLGTGDFQIRVEIHSPTDFQSFDVPSHPATDINILSDSSRIAYYHPQTPDVSRDFEIFWTQSPLPQEGSLLTHVTEDGQGYFFHVFAPDMADLGGSPMAKDIIFVLDKSGSMSGTKIQQLKDSFSSIVDDLRSEDRFNVVFFDDSIDKYSNEIIPVSGSTRNDAKTYIDRISADGSTNINDALITALEMFPDSSGTVPIIVFLTDGQPTAGETWTDNIRSNVMAANSQSVAIFSLAFGNDCDFPFLEALSLENFATAQRVDANTDASVQFQNFYETVSTPLLKNINFGYDADVSQVYPSHADQLFEGSEIAVVGRFNASRTDMGTTITARSEKGDETFEKVFPVKDTDKNDFIPRMWAYKRINNLLNQIKVEGESQTLIDEIVDLAMDNNFVTPYTAMVMVADDPEYGENEEEDNEQGEKTSYDDDDTDDDYPSSGNGFNMDADQNSWDAMACDDDDCGDDDDCCDDDGGYGCEDESGDDCSNAIILCPVIGIILSIILIAGIALARRRKRKRDLKKE